MQSLMIDVRAVTQGFTQDLNAMRSNLDGSLISGFTQAGNVLDSSLSGALRNGTKGFTDLRAVGSRRWPMWHRRPAACSRPAVAVWQAACSACLARFQACRGGPLAGRFPRPALCRGRAGARIVRAHFGRCHRQQRIPDRRRWARCAHLHQHQRIVGRQRPQAMARSTRQMASALRRALSQN
jgi:hypothetical protein